MKKFLTIVAIAGTLVACKQNKTAVTDQTRVLSATDSAEFKKFQQWKERKEKAAEKTVVYKSESQAAAPTVAAPVEKKKKGWSKAAQGAVIGGTTGAVAGAIISKNKVAGAVVGGVVGAGVGYGIGRSKDKKDGRY
jgi:uncharacterized iron-regulated membrane protein